MSLSSGTRYKQSLRESLRQVSHRAIRVSSRELEAFLHSRLPQRPDSQRSARDLGFQNIEGLIEHFRTRREPHFLGFTLGDNEAARQEFAERFPTAAVAIKAQADSIRDGDVELHGRSFSSNGRIAWHVDPWSGRDVPIRYARYYRFNTRSDFPEGSVDPEFLLELHTHQHLTRLGQAYYLSGDKGYVTALVQQLGEWIDLFPSGFGFPYLMSLNVAQRLISWCILYTLMKPSQIFIKSFFPPFLSSIALQGRFVYQHLSVSEEVTNNHLLTECTALRMVALLFPEFPQSEQWEQRAVEILQGELAAQILPDGTSFEQSTGYHRYVVELLLLLHLCNTVSPKLPLAVDSQLRGLLLSLMRLAGPDGRLPQIGDFSADRAFWVSSNDDIRQTQGLLALGAALLEDAELKWGAGETVEDVFWMSGPAGLAVLDNLPARQPDQTSVLLPEGGFAVLRDRRTPPVLQAVVDCGEVGCAGRGGHGHNDVLSFVLWANGSSIFVDPGTYTYFGSRHWRNKFRGTTSHNLVQVDGQEIAALGSGLFEITSAVSPQVHQWVEHEDAVLFDASHRGYLRLSDPVTHRRQLLLLDSPALVLCDRLDGQGTHSLVWRFHCDPGVLPEKLSSGDLHLATCDGSGVVLLWLQDSPLDWQLDQCWISPQYGQKVQAPLLSLMVDAPLPFHLQLGIMPVDAAFRLDSGILDCARSRLKEQLVQRLITPVNSGSLA